MNLEKYQQYSRIARGLEKADLVLKDARIVNVFTEEIIRRDIAIQDGIIAGIGEAECSPGGYRAAVGTQQVAQGGVVIHHF